MESTEWENMRTGDIVRAWEENLGPDQGYRVQLVEGASPIWYEKHLFEQYYRHIKE